jgi:BirA family biotin operon repressor/biotin-[acetyl-CoA-carboxylase] ligase
LNSDSIALDATKIIAGHVAGYFRIETYPTIDSTSNELRRRAETENIDGLVIAAETQSAGRGRHGRTWIDRPGTSLLFSVGWHPGVALAALSGLSLAVGVAVCRALEGGGTTGIRLKWPNDLLYNHCKLGGILVETATGIAGPSVILGIGLNVCLPESARALIAAPVTDLAAAGWRDERNRLLAALLNQLAAALPAFAASGLASFREDWLARHAHQRRNVRIWRDGQPIAAGRAIDVDIDGALLIQTAAGIERLLSGELTLRPG